MPNKNGVITAPVNLVYDVYPVLGLGPKNGEYPLDYACSNEHGKINIWSKNKPMRFNKLGDLTEADKYLLMYGLKFYSNYEEPMDGRRAVYEPPVPGENDCRLTDFEGYNHKAECPIADFSDLCPHSLNPRTYQKFVVDADLFFNKGENVEIPLPSVAIRYNYVGLAFLNRETREGLYYTNGTTIEAAFEQGEQDGQYVSLSNLKCKKGDIIDVYLISAHRPWTLEETYLRDVQRLDLTETNGHTYFVVTGWSIKDDIGYIGSSGTVYDSVTYVRMTYTYNGGDFTCTYFAVRLQSTYPWDREKGEVEEVYWECVVGGQTLENTYPLKPTRLSVANASQWIEFETTECKGEVTIPATELRDDQYLVDVFFYVRQSNEKRLLVQGRLNVQTGEWKVIQR